MNIKIEAATNLTQAATIPNTATIDFTTTVYSVTTTAVTTKKIPENGVLVLSTAGSSQVPLVISLNGDRIKPNFKHRDSKETQILGTCTVNWKNQNYIFGGVDKMRQILKIEDCKVKNIGELTFNHRFGTCATVSNEVIYLCFNHRPATTMKLCRTSQLPTGTFTDITKSLYDHPQAKIVNSDLESKWVFNLLATLQAIIIV